MTECKDKLDQYIKEEKLGEGTYGVVYKCKDKETGNYVRRNSFNINKRNINFEANASSEYSKFNRFNSRRKASLFSF